MIKNKKVMGITISIICAIIVVSLFLIVPKFSSKSAPNNKKDNSSISLSNPIQNDSNINTDNNDSSSNMESSNANSNSTSNTTENTNSNKPTNNVTSVSKPLTTSESVDKLLNEMTLDEKIAQMLIISVNGTTFTNTTKNALTKYKPGGIILFANNLDNYNTTIKFIDDMKSTSDIPLIISIDQEGGKVQRLTSIKGKSATYIPPMYSLGSMNDESLAYSVGTVIAEELRVFGINMDFAPVLDVLTSKDSKVIGDRSFGTSPELVSKMGVSFAKGLESKGVIPVYKHFPGHGSTKTDSHYDLPVLSKTKEELYSLDLIPFQNAIENNAKVIMIGHLAIPNITGDKTPASLSKVLITDLLKKEMGYKGLVITDALNMGALTNNYTEKQIYEMAINAGVDILLMPKSAESAISCIKQSIKEGKITESQINESVRKILMLKYTNLKTDKLSTSYLGSKEHQDIVNKIK